MIIIDHLYGAICPPDWLRLVLLSPEVQRLRDVRLINTSSPSCPALSDARRFTHTAGVLYLASSLCVRMSGYWSEADRRTFLVASILHDVGTPAFGHLFEYQLAALKNWNHEEFVANIIRGTYRPEKRYHQIYYAKALRLHDILAELDVDPDSVVALVRGEGPMGKILAGSIDLDNIDTVFRMACLLGLRADRKGPVSLVDSILHDSEFPMFTESALQLLANWQLLRKEAYEILAFDESCLSGQAMLTECLTEALRSELLGEEHWFYTDEELLRHLSEDDSTKNIIQRFAIGDFYDTLFLGWYNCPRGDADLRHPENLSMLAEELSDCTGIPCRPYVFYDSGTFSKELRIKVRFKGGREACVNLGVRSQSTIVAVFTPHRINDSQRRKARDLIVEVLESRGLSSRVLAPLPRKEDIYDLPRQKAIPF